MPDSGQFRLVRFWWIATLCRSRRQGDEDPKDGEDERFGRPMPPVWTGSGDRCRFAWLSLASVAQLAEQLICNQPVVGSSPSAGSLATGRQFHHLQDECRVEETDNGQNLDQRTRIGGLPEWLKGADCKSVGYAYTGSNPVAPTE